MSAIVGVFRTDLAPLPRDELDPLLASLAHRGPDGSRQWRSGPVALGQQHRRVTPESADEWLPLWDPEARIALVADCRLDNRDDLCAALSIPAVDRATLVDSRLLLMAYRHWGPRFVDELVGDFAFAIWDERAQRLLCGRDPMGVCRLYTYRDDSRFVFASEIRGVLAHPAVPMRLNRRKAASLAVPMFTVVEDTTFFDGIRRLPAATTLEVRRDQARSRTYWRPDPSARLDLPAGEVAEAFRECWLTAVSARLRTPQSVAALLSGGLDSSAVVAAAAHVLRRQNRSLITLSAVLPPGSPADLVDETPFIKQFEGWDNVEQVFITEPERGPFDDLERLAWSVEAPLATSRHFLYTAFAEAADQRRARVMLDGVGGELGPSFDGSGYFSELLGSGRWWRLTHEVRQRASRINRPLWHTLLSQAVRPWLQARLPPWPGTGVRFDLAQFRRFPVQTGFVEKVLGSEVGDMARIVAQLGRPSRTHRSAQVKAIEWTQRTTGSGGFVGSESVSMAYPFLDRRVLEFGLAAPGELKVHDGYSRYLVRSGLDGLLPPAIQWRSTKEPFSPDYHLRYNRQRPAVLSQLSAIASNDPVRDIVDVDRLARLAAVDMEGNRSDTPSAFAAMHLVPLGCMLIAFLRRFSDYGRSGLE